MAQWGVRRQVVFINQHQDNEPEHSCSISEEENLEDEDKGTIKSESPVMPESRKRRRISSNVFKEMKPALSAKDRNSKSKTKKHKHAGSKDRWSAERYKLAEQSMLEILKTEGATFGNAISRPALRMAAREHIGDTGLLDHLLKHIDGKVAPSGTERFRRWFSCNGVMEYWLESADLVNIRKQAGVEDPYWIPPQQSEQSPGGGPTEDSVSARELKLLKEELEKMKCEMQELRRKQELYGANQVEEVFKKMVKWKVDTDQTLETVLNSWKGIQVARKLLLVIRDLGDRNLFVLSDLSCLIDYIYYWIWGLMFYLFFPHEAPFYFLNQQDMNAELMTWKAKVDQQLVEFNSSLSHMQESKHYIAPSLHSPERWKNLLENTNLDNVQDDEFISWFESTNLVNIEPEVILQDPCLRLPFQSKPGDCTSQGSACAREVELLKKEGVDTKSSSDAQDVVLKQKDDQAMVTPDSSTTANSQSDLHNSIFQEKILELLNWKAKVDEKLIEISNSINLMIRHQNNEFLCH